PWRRRPSRGLVLVLPGVVAGAVLRWHRSRPLPRGAGGVPSATAAAWLGSAGVWPERKTSGVPTVAPRPVLVVWCSHGWGLPARASPHPAGCRAPVTGAGRRPGGRRPPWAP